jgi:hypothetical protein
MFVDAAPPSSRTCCVLCIGVYRGVAINTAILLGFQADDDHPPFVGFLTLQFWLVVLTNAAVGLTISVRCVG